MQANRHPADELYDVRSEIRRLEDRERELRSYLFEQGLPANRSSCFSFRGFLRCPCPLSWPCDPL